MMGKILDTILNKEKVMVLGKIRRITLIEANLQYVMRIYLNNDVEELIEEDERISK